MGAELPEVAARSDGSGRPGSRQPAQPPRCKPERTEVPAEPPVDSGPQTPEVTAERPVPPPPVQAIWNQPLIPASAPPRTLTISRFPESPSVLPAIPKTSVDHSVTKGAKRLPQSDRDPLTAHDSQLNRGMREKCTRELCGAPPTSRRSVPDWTVHKARLLVPE